MGAGQVSVGVAGPAHRAKRYGGVERVGSRAWFEDMKVVDMVEERRWRLRMSEMERRSAKQMHWTACSFAIIFCYNLLLVEAEKRCQVSFPCCVVRRASMASKYAFTTGLREVRFHLCSSSQASDAARYRAHLSRSCRFSALTIMIAERS